MKQKYAIGFITFMLATVLAACVHDYPAMTPDGEEGIDPTLVEVSTEVTLDLELLPLEIITNKAHRGITKARAGEQTDYRRRFIIESWRDGKPAALQLRFGFFFKQHLIRRVVNNLRCSCDSVLA